MHNKTYYLRHYPISIIFLLCICILSLVPIFPETPLDDIQFIDKWTHVVMYGGTCIMIWYEYLSCHKKHERSAQKLIVFAVLAPILFGALMELLQRYCTFGYRSGEWLDAIADAVGVIVAAIIGIIFSKMK